MGNTDFIRALRRVGVTLRQILDAQSMVTKEKKARHRSAQAKYMMNKTIADETDIKSISSRVNPLKTNGHADQADIKSISASPTELDIDKRGSYNNNIISNNRARGTRLPEDWNPSDDLWLWGKDHGLSQQVLRTQTAKFKDYWWSKPGENATKLNWDRTWKNWMRDQITNKPNGNGIAPHTRWFDVQSEYKAKYGAEAFKRYNDDIREGRIR